MCIHVKYFTERKKYLNMDYDYGFIWYFIMLHYNMLPINNVKYYVLLYKL